MLIIKPEAARPHPKQGTEKVGACQLEQHATFLPLKFAHTNSDFDSESITFFLFISLEDG